MIIQRNDPAFWEVRTLERRIRRGELTRKALEEHLSTLPDIAEKATASKPLEEPIERMQPRRPAVRITAAPTASRGLLDGDDDLDDELLADDEDDDDDLDEDEDDEDGPLA